MHEPIVEPIPLVGPRDPITPGRALAEVVLCSGFPTQIVAAVGLAIVGIRPGDDGSLTPLFIFAVSAIDTVLLIGLIFVLLYQSGDSARAIFLDGKPVPTEIAFGVMTVPLVLGMVMLVQMVIHAFAPYLRNVPVNPFESLLGSPLLIAGFAALVIIAGGLREELQRAFLLNRFKRRLGGPIVGVLVTSLAFGLGHTVQGWDAALITSLLGATWGTMYLQRRSVIGTITCHAFFNLAQVAVAYVILQN